MKKDEKRFEEKIKSLIASKGGWQIKYWAGGGCTKAGIPDILACVNGRFLGVEVKAEHGRPSPLQIMNLRKIQDAGGFGILLYPKDFEIFKALLSELEKPVLVRHEAGMYFEELLEAQERRLEWESAS